MRKIFALAAAASLLAVSGAQAFSTQETLVGHSIRAVAADGTVSVVHFEAGGVAHLDTGGQHIMGAWALEGDQLCFDWPDQARECWPWDGALEPGVTVSATSDQGDTVLVTLEE